MRKGKYLKSRNGKYKLKLQENGNLEIFCGAISIWQSKTVNENVDFLYFDVHGNLVLFGKDDSIIWSVALRQNANRLIMQGDGNLVLYREDSHSVWASDTNDKCDSNKGLGLSLSFSFLFFFFSCVALIISTSSDSRYFLKTEKICYTY